ncbi:MAG: VCBS repeat-containing protein, partial [Bacteroidales bacterium]|nr:VCBS repeat-containing protein [Bacteroidales bacterium]
KDLDFVVGASASTVWWFEYLGNEKWKINTVGSDALTDRGGIMADIDNDGDLDQLSGGTFFKNNGAVPPSFERIENNCIYAYDNIAADVNGDGILELISTSEQDGTFLYFYNPKPGKKWKGIELGDGVSGGIWPKGYGDIDGDGDIDIVRSNVWYKNIDGNGTKWSEHKTLRFTIPQQKNSYSSRTYVVDMDGDGDMDVIQTQANTPSGSVAWLENKDTRGLTWYTHPIGTDTKQDLHTLCVADFDNDGDLDVFTGGGPMKEELYERCFIFENPGPEETKWPKHEVLFDKECIDAVAGDVDGDGDIDICGKPWKGTTCFYLKNMLIEKQ